MVELVAALVGAGAVVMAYIAVAGMGIWLGIFEADCGPFTPADGACSRWVFLWGFGRA